MAVGTRRGLLRLAAACIVVALCPCQTDAKQTGWRKLKTHKSRKFIDRFVFRPLRSGDEDQQDSKGVFSYEIRHRVTDEVQLLVFYNGWEDFNDVYESGYSQYSCMDLVHASSTYVTLAKTSGTTFGEDNITLTSIGEVTFSGSQPRWWFIVLANCADVVTDCNDWVPTTERGDDYTDDAACVYPECFNGIDNPFGVYTDDFEVYDNYCQGGLDVEYRFSFTNGKVSEGL